MKGLCTERAVRGRRLAIVAALSLGTLLSTAGVASAAPLLPDFEQGAPTALGIQQVGSEQHLGFDSTVRNVGAGGARISGSRPSTSVTDMTATQTVDQSDGGSVTYPDVGVIRYVIGGGHSHWHLLDFESYELNRIDGTNVERDRKTGFCLNIGPDNCGQNQPDLLAVSMGLGAGFSDVYHANLEGQFIDITAVPAGDYDLVNRVNPTGSLQETSLANNAASVRIRLTRDPDGVAVLPAPHDRPQSATLLSVSLVPAFRQTISDDQCSARGGTPSLHEPPLAFSACDPPGYAPATVAAQGPLSRGLVQLTAAPGDPTTAVDEADLAIGLDVSDVRERASGGDYAPNAGGPDVTLVTKLTLSDTNNGGGDPATVVDFDYPVGADCTETLDPDQGSACSVATSADSLMAGTITEGTQMVLQVYRIRVNDSGSNGVPGDGDDRVFAQQGIFVP